MPTEDFNELSGWVFQSPAEGLYYIQNTFGGNTDYNSSLTNRALNFPYCKYVCKMINFVGKNYPPVFDS